MTRWSRRAGTTLFGMGLVLLGGCESGLMMKSDDSQSSEQGSEEKEEPSKTEDDQTPLKPVVEIDRVEATDTLGEAVIYLRREYVKSLRYGLAAAGSDCSGTEFVGLNSDGKKLSFDGLTANQKLLCFKYESQDGTTASKSVEFTVPNPIPEPTSLAFEADQYDFDRLVSQVNLTPQTDCDTCGFSISPELPEGLEFDSKTGTIKGTPTALSPNGEYTVTASNAAGSKDVTVSIAVGTDRIATDSFQTVSDATMPATTGDGAVHVIDGTIYKFGGAYGGSYACSNDSGLHIFSAPADTPMDWTDHGTKLPTRFSYGGLDLIVDDTLYLFSSSCSGNILTTSVSDPLDGWQDTGESISGSTFRFTAVHRVGDSLYAFGVGANYDEIWSAPVSNPLSWSDSGKRMPEKAQHAYFFPRDDKLFIVKHGTPAAVFSASADAPTDWKTLGTTIDIPGNAGVSMTIGDTAYILGGHNDDVIYKAPRNDMLAWDATPHTLPTAGHWGINAHKVIGDTIYFFGGQRKYPTG